MILACASRGAWFALAAGALALAGCGAPPIATLSELDQTIVNGQLDTGDPAVVALTVQGQMFCSGTLVTQRVVLTAAHCVHPDTVPVPVTEIEIYFGNDVSSGQGTFVSVIDGGPHPDWDLQNPDPSNDVGVLRMFEDGPTAPIPLATQAFDGTFVGKEARLIGFGITMGGGNDPGIKRQTTSSIDSFDAHEFSMPFAPSGTCNGDSGGPALLMEGGKEVVAGVHSLSDCETYAIDERVDAHVAEFIQPFIDDEPRASCSADGLCAKGCPSFDPDCPCAADGFCTAACTAPETDADCVAKCAADGECIAKGCATPDPDCKCLADGMCDATCASDPDCADPCGSDGTCRDGCDPVDPDCADGDGDPSTKDAPAAEEDSGCGCSTPGGPPGARLLGGLVVLVVLSGLRRARRRPRVPGRPARVG